MRRGEQAGAHRLLIGIGVDPVDICARGHHLAGGAVGEAHHARNDRALAFLEYARRMRLGDDEMQFLGRHLAVAVAG